MNTTLTISFVIGVAGSLLATAIWKSFSIFLPSFGVSSFTVRGFWITPRLISSDGIGFTVEIMKIHQRGEKISFYLENHNSQRRKILRLRGQGLYRNSCLSAFYYFSDRSNPDIGNFTLKSRASKDGSTTLIGVYTQFVEREHISEPSVKPRDYQLSRLYIPISRQLRLLIGKPVFSTYEAALSVVPRIEEHNGHWEAEQPAPHLRLPRSGSTEGEP